MAGKGVTLEKVIIDELNAAFMRVAERVNELDFEKEESSGIPMFLFTANCAVLAAFTNYLNQIAGLGKAEPAEASQPTARQKVAERLLDVLLSDDYTYSSAADWLRAVSYKWWGKYKADEDCCLCKMAAVLEEAAREEQG